MASVYKRGNKWYASFKGPNGWTSKAAGTDKTAAMQIANGLETAARFRREGLVDPKADALAAAEKLAIAGHLADFKRDIAARRGNEKYATQTHQRAERVLAYAGVERLSQINPASVNDAVKRLRDGDSANEATHSKAKRPHSKASITHHLRAVKMFSRWLLRNGRMRDDGLVSVRVGGSVAKSERVHVRRALSGEEFERLITHTAGAGVSLGMSGNDRAMLYRVAGATGLRQGELRSLTRASFDLSADDPGITVRAAYSKRRKDDRQPVAPELAAILAPWLENKPAAAPVFNLPDATKIADMLRTDAAAARAGWIGEAMGSVKAARVKSSFLADADASRGVLDFHALRHSYISWLVASGASVSVCQALARHSTPVLTLGVYSHPTLADQGRALAALPLAPLPKPNAEAMKATGTHGNAEHPANAVELVKKTGAISGLRLAQVDAPNAGNAWSNKPHYSRGKTLDLPVFAGQNASPRPGGGTADAEDLKSFEV